MECFPDDRRLRYACAGCPGPIYLSAEKEPRFLDTPGFAVGMLEDATYEEQELLLDAGDRLFIYSDGVSEAANEAGELFGKERVGKVVTANRARSVHVQVQAAQLPQATKIVRIPFFVLAPNERLPNHASRCEVSRGCPVIVGDAKLVV